MVQRNHSSYRNQIDTYADCRFGTADEAHGHAHGLVVDWRIPSLAAYCPHYVDCGAIRSDESPALRTFEPRGAYLRANLVATTPNAHRISLAHRPPSENRCHSAIVDRRRQPTGLDATLKDQTHAVPGNPIIYRRRGGRRSASTTLFQAHVGRS